LNADRHAFAFEDEGTALVDARQRQTSVFGSLSIIGCPFTPENLQRLLKFDQFDSLVSVGDLQGEYALIPLSAKADSLIFFVYPRTVEAEDIIASFNFSAKTLFLSYKFGRAENRSEMFVSVMNRLAQLGHLENFILYDGRVGSFAEDLPLEVPMEDIARIADAMIHFIHNNQHLKCLRLHRITWLMKCVPQLEKIFLAVENSDLGRSLSKRCLMLMGTMCTPGWSDCFRTIERSRYWMNLAKESRMDIGSTNFMH
jgi:hypothetical protein